MAACRRTDVRGQLAGQRVYKGGEATTASIDSVRLVLAVGGGMGLSYVLRSAHRFPGMVEPAVDER